MDTAATLTGMLFERILTQFELQFKPLLITGMTK